jgi:catechol 2,3-dioxygenase-like lactoylglutathione lyase family enzyme
MITKLSHATIYVKDQDAALEFYTKKLGFEKRMDATMGDLRWLTVGPKGQELEIVLMQPKTSPLMDAETVEKINALIEKGALGAGVWETDDCRKTYTELVARGVEFLAEPQERPYGIEALFRDDSGNWFSLTERR